MRNLLKKIWAVIRGWFGAPVHTDTGGVSYESVMLEAYRRYVITCRRAGLKPARFGNWLRRSPGRHNSFGTFSPVVPLLGSRTNHDVTADLHRSRLRVATVA